MASRTFLITFVLLSVISNPTHRPALAQETSKQAAVKFDEFGDIPLTDIKARLDNFAIELQNNSSVHGFIIVYRARRDLPGLNNRLARLMKGYLVNLRGISADRIATVDGGIAECFTQQFWVVPIGTTPTPRSDAYANEFTDTESAQKFDEFYYYIPDESLEDEPYEYLESGDALEGFAAELRRQPRSLAYIIVYPQYYVMRSEESNGNGSIIKARQIVHLDSPERAQKVLREVKAELVKTHHILPSRIKVVNGGYRKLRQVELWIVPRGEHAPIATPNAFPKQRAKRRSIRRR